MSGGGAPVSSFPSPFSYLFPAPPQPFLFPPQQPQQQRFKLKRQRQRVDAGEPRNSYQQPRHMSTEGLNSFLNWSQTDLEYSQMKDEQPQDLSTKVDHIDEPPVLAEYSEEAQLDVEAVETNEDKEHDETDVMPADSSSTSPSSQEGSSSKRKQTQPQKTLVDGLSIDRADGPEEIRVSSAMEKTEQSEEQEDTVEDTEDIEKQTANPLEKLSALQSQLNTPSLADIMEAQRRFIMEQQRRASALTEEKPRIKDLSQLAQILKTEWANFIDKKVAEFQEEQARAAAAAAAAAAEVPRQPVQHLFNGMFPQHNLLFPLQQATVSAASGIFPHFNGFNTFAALNQLKRGAAEEEAIKKKRAKVTDSVRMMKGECDSPMSRCESPQLSQTPNLSSYFPPTMVGHPLYGQGFFGDREDSPTNSDDNSDSGPYDSSLSTTLTPMHLRKAKLMFFYTRYPNSTLLKSYFPDIRFNKNNTAQLVKWFSNFREFYYIQMEKYARQALAEGVQSREELHVTMDSEIFKTLNQHYNRNNHVQAPERLVNVVEETLREFFDAVKHHKDLEPSWKKSIYKLITRLDDQIPEYFKDPNFLDKLDS